MTARSLAGLTGSTIVIALDAQRQEFIGWTPDSPTEGFSIEGGQGYIVNVPKARRFAFIGSVWTNPVEEETASAPGISSPQSAWAFVVSGRLSGRFDDYQVIIRNARSGEVMTASVEGDYFAVATADLSRKSVVEAGDEIEIQVISKSGNIESSSFSYRVTPEMITNAMISVRLDDIGKPKAMRLLQNYPNPFNPETWIPYQLSKDSEVSISIYDITGELIRRLSLGYQQAGFYTSRDKAVYWDGRNDMGESVTSGIYFYQLSVGDYSETQKMLILK